MKFIDIDTLFATIGNNLHTIRNARKETLQAVASNTGISHPILSKIENGRYNSLRIDILIQLCNYYNISLQQALSLEVANIFQLTQHNKAGSQRLIGQELSTGFELFVHQLQKENEFLKKHIQDLTQAQR